MSRRLRRAWAFGRHIPPSKLLRRLYLSARRRVEDRVGPRLLPAPKVTLRDDLPCPVFPPRGTGALCRDGEALRARFLGHEERFADGQIDWAAPGPDAASQLWRMTLHYMEYLEACDDADFATVLDSWIEAHPSPRPGDWRDSWNAYALSIRVVVWLQQLAARRGRLDPALVSRAGDSVAAQVAHLTRNMETDIGGNHLIKNIKALLWAGAAFDGEAAQRWRLRGRTLLTREFERQVLPDGVHFERSPSYHAQVFADLIECRLVQDAPMPPLDAALDRMAQATADLSHPDGLAAQFNDAGLHMAYTPAACLDAHAALTGKTAPRRRARFAFPQAGYFGVHSDRISLIADCGPIAPDDLPAHGHGDILSFELSAGAARVVVDPGVFEYIAGPRRAVSRAAASHNTLTVAGADQAEFFGAFRMGRRARILQADWRETEKGATLTGAHDGFAHLPGRPVHRRTITAEGHQVVILDQVQTAQPHPARLAFLLHPEVKLSPRGTGFDLTTAAGDTLRLDSGAELAEEAAVWWPDMGVEVPTRRLVGRLAPGLTEVRTTIRLDDRGSTT